MKRGGTLPVSGARFQSDAISVQQGLPKRFLKGKKGFCAPDLAQGAQEAGKIPPLP
jgi:hypothetical protein